MNHAGNMATGRGVEDLDRAVIWIIGPYTGPAQTKRISKRQVQSGVFRKNTCRQHFPNDKFWKAATLGRSQKPQNRSKSTQTSSVMPQQMQSSRCTNRRALNSELILPL